MKYLRWFYYEIDAQRRQLFCKSYRYEGTHDWVSNDDEIYYCADCGVTGEPVK